MTEQKNTSTLSLVPTTEQPEKAVFFMYSIDPNLDQSQEQFTHPTELHYKLQAIYRRYDGYTSILDVLPLVKDQIGGTHHLKMTFQGRLVKAQTIYTTQQPWKRGQRGQVLAFSPASRRRLMELFARLDMRQKAVFLTLTYEQTWPNAKTAKTQLKAFLKRLERLCDGRSMSAVWKLEFQERGAPHFHLILFDLPYIPKEQIQTMWAEIIGGVAPFTRIEMIHTAKKLTNYVSKYVAKVVDPPPVPGGFNSPTYLAAYIQKHGETVGRYWGIFSRSNLPFAERIEFTWPSANGEFMQFRKLAILEYPPIEQQRSLGFTLYVRNAYQWRDIFDRLSYT